LLLSAALASALLGAFIAWYDVMIHGLPPAYQAAALAAEPVVAELVNPLIASVVTKNPAFATVIADAQANVAAAALAYPPPALAEATMVPYVGRHLQTSL
jgi:hypothetical protein